MLKGFSLKDVTKTRGFGLDLANTQGKKTFNYLAFHPELTILNMTNLFRASQLLPLSDEVAWVKHGE